MLWRLEVVVVVQAFGHEASNADLAEVGEEGADLVGRSVDVITAVSRRAAAVPYDARGNWSCGLGWACR
jgi:hypothetical protein